MHGNCTTGRKRYHGTYHNTYYNRKSQKYVHTVICNIKVGYRGIVYRSQVANRPFEGAVRRKALARILRVLTKCEAKLEGARAC